MRCVLTESAFAEGGNVVISVNGESLLLDASGAAYSRAHAMLVFADLHLEKGSAYARSRQFLPPYDTSNTLSRMAQVMARYRPSRVICLGDSFHDGAAADRLTAEDRQHLQFLSGKAQFTWIAGNHDPDPPAWASGDIASNVQLGSLTFRHAPLGAFEPGEVAGHLHPCSSVSKWGKSVRRRCFASDGVRLILPSFGAYTGGLDVGDPVIASLFGGPFHAYLLGQARVYAVRTRIAVRV